MRKELDTTYSPKDFESRIYDFWMDGDYFKAEIDENKEPFTIIMPPPNVTGELHLGHALQSTFQDVLTRWKRMKGYSALWLPGTDHASISTEARVVNKLKKEGKTKEEIGREAFLKEAWDWTHKYGGIIKDQMKRIGVSCDWERDTFTLDEGPSKAVVEVFVNLYEKGLIYQGDRIINWCPNCATGVSDAEVDHEDTVGKIWHFKYPIKDSDEYIIIATTRPETILGDLAVAVNPEDERYSGLIGKTVMLPLMDREIPIIADDYVDMNFGTGAVKITPSHDPNDFEIGERHNLGQLRVIDEEVKITDEGGKYQGLTREEARERVIEDFDKLGLLVKVEDNPMAIGHCDRCETIIEPLISKQWFVSMEEMAKPALEVSKTGELDFIPERFRGIYDHWLENIRDWNISRQLWWGHRLPVYYCDDCDEIMVKREKPEKCSKCDSTNIRQDEDVLDTWFSSALWPFSTLGWPDKSPDYDYFYPTDVLVTGYDIIFFWVIRMVFSALEQTDELPFDTVVLTGLIRDELGRKMSKSLDNGIDPLDVIDKYGADALRFTLITGGTPGNDMRFSYDRVEANRNFANKLWNASRFVLMNLDEEIGKKEFNIEEIKDKLEREDKWILTRLNKTLLEINRHLDQYDLAMSADEIYEFIWDEYCDWYIELVKSRLYGDNEETKEIAEMVLLYSLKELLKILHPFMPFITEEIWSYLPIEEGPLILQDWPDADERFNFLEAEKEIEYIKNAITRIRNLRSEMDIVPSRKSSQYFVTKDDKLKESLKEGERHFKDLAYADEIIVIDDMKEIQGETASVVIDRAEILLPLADLIDYEKELERLNKEKEKFNSEIKRAEGMLSNKGFTEGAPEHLVNAEKEKLESFKEMLENVNKRIEEVKNHL